MTKKRGLGKGLGALIPPASSPQPASVEIQAGAIEIPIDRISPNPHQPRHSIDQDRLQLDGLLRVPTAQVHCQVVRTAAALGVVPVKEFRVGARKRATRGIPP